MKQWFGELGRLFFITFLGFLGSMIAGLMLYGGEIFNPQTAGFAYFIIYGISTSFIFAFYHVRGLSNTITAAVSTGAIIFIIAMAWMPVINAVIWSFGVNLSVIVVAFLFERKLQKFKQWKFIFVGVYYGAVFVLLTLFVSLLTKVEGLPSSLFQSNFLDGLWLGLSLGVGIEIAESILHSIDLHVHAVQEKQETVVEKPKVERVISPRPSRKKRKAGR
jgi:hypothetical protein